MGLAAGALAGFTPEELKELAAVDVRTVDINSLTDLREIEIDTKAPVEKSWHLLQSRRKTRMSTGLGIMW